MKKIVIVFAGGSGQRMGGEIPKQFLELSGKKIIIHTLELFEENEDIDEIYIACIEEWIEYLNHLIERHNIQKIRRVFPGGATGQDSIFIGLSEVKKDHDNAIVLIHDGVRPLVSQETITTCINSVEEFGSAVTVTPCYETPISSQDGIIVDSMPLRQTMYTAQAPQCFYLNDLYNAHLAERKINPNYDGVVDSCGLMFKRGFQSHLIEGNRGNIKVTTRDDFFHLMGYYNARDYQNFLLVTEAAKEKPITLEKRKNDDLFKNS